jgi:hypothetical protein
MKIKKLFLVTMVASLLLAFPTKTLAQGMMGQFFNNSGSSADVSSTAKDEAEGKIIFDKLQSKQVTCQELSDDDFDVLGDYYMGQMAGSTEAHAQMNARMTRMMGENGEKQMHIALGKRLSGCNTGAAYSPNNPNSGFAPMMGYGGGMMANFYNNYGFNITPIIFLLAVIVIGSVFLIQFLGKNSNKRKK